MADEAIIRIVIQDEGAYKDAQYGGIAPVPDGSAPTPGGIQDSAFSNAQRGFTSALGSLRSEIDSVTVAIRQLKAAVPKAIGYQPSEYATNPQATPYERMQQLGTTYRYKASREEIAGFSKAEFDAYIQEQQDQRDEYKKIIDSTRLTRREREVAEALLYDSIGVNEIAANMGGVSDKYVYATAASANKKLGFPKGLLRKLAGESAEASKRDQGEAGKYIDWIGEKEAPGKARKKDIEDISQSLADQLLSGKISYEDAEKVARKAIYHKATGGWLDPEDNPDAFMDESDFDIPIKTSDEPTEIGPNIHPFGAAYELSGEHHAEGGSIPAALGTPKHIFPYPPKYYDPSMMDMYPKDALQKVYKTSNNDIDAARKVADYIYQFSLAPKNVYKRVLENVANRLPDVDISHYLSVANKAVAIAKDFDPQYPDAHHARGGRIDMSRGGSMPNTGMAPSGSDWHPAWLTDREFVMNAKSAARNREALQSANSDPNVTLVARHFARGGGYWPYAANVASSAINAAGLTSATVGPTGPVPPVINPTGPLMTGLDIAGGPIGQAIALGATLIGDAEKDLQAAVIGATKSVGAFTLAVADPDANPSKLMSGLGDAVTSGGERISKAVNGPLLNALGVDLIPGLKLFTGVIGETAHQLSILMDTITATSKRYGEYSPDIAVADAMVEVQHTMGELRRAQEAGPELARYLRAQGDLQQKYEDLKVRLLTKIVPIVTQIVSLVEGGMTAVDAIVTAIGAVADPFNAVAAGINRIAFAQEDANREEVQDPTNMLLQQNLMENNVPPG